MNLMLGWRPAAFTRRYWHLIEVETGRTILGIDGYPREFTDPNEAARWAVNHGHTLDPRSEPKKDGVTIPC